MSKFVGIKTYERFRSLWENNDIDEFSLNFILDTGQLYTHGVFINSAVFGTAANGAVQLSIAGTTNTLALSSHTHSNYYDKSENLDITNHKIISGDNDLLFCSGGALYIGNINNPTYISGSTIQSIKGQNTYTILDTENFSISNTLPTGYTHNNTAYIEYGGNSFQIDYVKRVNTSQSFDYLNSYTQAGTNLLNGDYYGYINFTVDNVYNNPAWAQLRINITGRSIQYRTSADVNNWINLGIPSIPQNALNVAGIVSAPNSSTQNKVWKTDKDGNPGWRDERIYSFASLVFQQIAGTELESYNTQTQKTILAGSNISFSCEDNVITINAQDTTYSTFTGASASEDGSSGLVTAPNAGNQDKFLRGDGTWNTPLNTWRPIYLQGTATLTNSSTYLNIAPGNNISLAYAAPGTETGQSGNANYATLTISATNTWIAWKGATETSNGVAGYMPAPTSTQRNQFLRGDGAWVSLNNYTLPTATNLILGGIKVGTTLDDISGYTAIHIKDDVAYYKDTTYSFSKLKFQQTSGTDLMTYDSQAVRTVLAGSNVTFTHSNNILTIKATDTTYSTATSSVLGLIKIGTTLNDVTGYTKIHIKDGFAYYHDTTYSFSKLKFQQTSGTDLMTYDSQATRTIVAGNNITFTHSNNVLTIAAKDTTYSTVSKTAAGLCPILPNETTTTKYLRQDGSWIAPPNDNTWKAANTSQEGYVPKLTTNGGTIATQSTEYVLTFKSGTDSAPVWRLLPANAYKNTWTSWQGATSSANGTAGYMPAPTSEQRGQFLRGDGSWVSLNNYSLPKATTSALGGIIVSNVLTTAVTLTSSNGTTTNRYYGVQLDKDGKAFVNIPWIWTAFTAASSNAAGTAGYIQAPKGAQNKFFRGDNTWQTINQNVTSALYVGASNGTSTSAQSTNGNVYLIFAEGSSYSRYKISGSGRASVTSDASGNITINSSGYSNFGAATASAAGTAGLVPAPGANKLGTGGYFLRADGSWAVPTNTWNLGSSSQAGYVPKATKNYFLHCNNSTGGLEWVANPNTNTWRNIYVKGSSKIGTGTDTKAINFAAGSNVSITYEAAGTEEGQSGSANYFNIKIAATNTWNANAVGVAGYVAAPTKANNANMTWQTDANGNPAWRASNNHSHNYLPLSGGTLTATLRIDYSGADFTKADNDVSGTKYPGFYVRDKNGKQTGRVLTSVQSDGKLITYLTSDNYDTSGNSVGSMYIGQEISKDGTKRWLLSDAASFRTALGLGSNAISSTEYLPLSGGTMTGAISFKSAISADNQRTGSVVGIFGKYGYPETGDTGYNKGGIGFLFGRATTTDHDSLSGIFINADTSTDPYSTTGGLYITASTIKFRGNTVWHEGNAKSLFISGLGSGTATALTDGTDIITSYADDNGFSGHNTAIYKRPASVIWNYIRNKITADTTITVANASYSTESSRFLSAQILPANTSGDANTMQLDGSGTVYSVLTNYNSNPKWQNMPTFGTDSYGGVVEIKGKDSSLKMQFAWSAFHNNTTAPTGGLWYRARANKGYLASDWHKVAFTDSNITGTASNITGIVAITHGGTGANSRLDAVKALTNENVSTNAEYFLTITSQWGKAGYTSVANAKTVLAMTGATADAAGAAGVVPAPPKSGYNTKFLRADGTWQVPPDTNTTYSDMTGATDAAAGTAGLVPAPGKGKQASFLRGDGKWVVPTDTNTDTNVTSTYTTPTSSKTWYALCTATADTVTGSAVKNTSIRFVILNGTAETAGYSRLYLGNSTATGTAGNMTGSILMYGSRGKYAHIIPHAGDTTDRTIYTPKSGGTLVVHTTDTAIGSSTKPVYISAAGVATEIGHTIAADVPSGAKFTDTTYSAGTLALYNTGTDTTNRVWSASVLKSIGDYYAKENYFYSGGVAKNAKHLPKGYGYDGGEGITNPYHLMAEATVSGTGARNITGVFLVSSFYSRSRGILFVQGRVDGSGTTINTTNTHARWITKDSDLNVNNFILTAKATSDSLTCKLYYKVTDTWDHARITLLDDSSWAYTTNTWVLHSSATNTAGSYVFKTIPSGETQFVSIDVTTSKYASQFSTSRTLWGQSFNGSANISGNMTSVGNITFTNNARIHQPDAAGNVLYLGNASNNGWVKTANICSQDGDSYWRLTTSGLANFKQVGINIGTSNPSYPLHVSGNVGASNFYTTSDRSKKQNISTFSEHIRKFQLKDTEKWHYGVIAQEVEEMFRDGKEGNMTVNYNSVLSYYIGQLENRVKELEDKLKKYEDKVKKC